MEIKRIAVLGAGIMGNGIAQVSAAAGYEVFLRDVEDRFLQRARETMEKSLDRMAKKGKIAEEEVAKILGRVKGTTDFGEAVSEADLVIEAVPENLELKRSTFRDLAGACRPETILASNTSNFSITNLASVTGRAANVIGMHYFNPPAMMNLIEVVRGLDTSDETLQVVLDFAARCGKKTVVCKDSQGFITSRMINLWLVEAERILEEGVATREDIDAACRLAFNHPMGPFELADFSGLDTKLAVADAMCQMFGDRFRSPQTVRNLVSAGYLGRKSGKGWYDYSK
ncbi:MAG: 3-hydroxyacyl-CoA dehydrogenase family protein [Deltaproteobacteria bacterium]|nr:3-hydroxyacyl-CoA dehydrogenase family protein [Deltaproteobacteria bacterium]